MSSNALESLLTVSQVAGLLGLHRMTVYEKVTRGEIPHFRIGRAIRFDRGELNRWIAEKHAESAAETASAA